MDNAPITSIAYGGPKRFGELRRRLGSISTKTLTTVCGCWRPRVGSTGITSRTVPPKVTYTLAKRVLESDPVMIELDRIAEAVVGGRKKTK